MQCFVCAVQPSVRKVCLFPQIAQGAPKFLLTITVLILGVPTRSRDSAGCISPNSQSAVDRNGGQAQDLWSLIVWHQILAPLLPRCVTLGKRPYLSVPQFPQTEIR